METKIYNQKGKETGKIALPEQIFGVPWNADLVYQVVNSLRSSARDSIAHTKTRGEVRGGGKKPWQQKGLGRARHGSIRSPIWVGGGIAHGPRNDKNYDRKVNKQAKTKALNVLLSKKFRDGEVLFLDSLVLDNPKTKEAKAVVLDLAKISGFEKFSTKPENVAVIAMHEKGTNVTKGFNNFGNISIEEYRNINPLMILNHKYLVITGAEKIFGKVENRKSSSSLRLSEPNGRVESQERIEIENKIAIDNSNSSASAPIKKAKGHVVSKVRKNATK